jgi:Kelch motif/Galactose oxidase, central domain
VKKTIGIFAAITLAASAKAQNWQFLKGGQTTNQNPIYNTLGGANPTTTPGSRMNMAGFVDPNAQTLYLFGGVNGSSYYNSTFVYNTGTGNWSYTTGANSANSSGTQPLASNLFQGYPSARAGMGFAVAPLGSGNRMFMKGGRGLAGNNSTVGILKSYYRTTSTLPAFQWLTGQDFSIDHNSPSNFFGGVNPLDPGSLTNLCVFTDNNFNSLWQFGGIDGDGFTNNAMMFQSLNPIGTTFTRVAGSTSREDPGSYNGQGNSGIPAARAFAAYWKDAAGNFWIFGGSSPDNGAMNDLWRFNPTTNVFTLVKGTFRNTTASYGTISTTSSSNFPPARAQASAVVSSDGKFYIFGGANGANYYNDLWQFDPTTNNWTWLKGSNTPNASASGFTGINSPTATPGAVKGAMAWRLNNTMYIYGGEGYDGNGNLGRLGDLWSIPLNNFTVLSMYLQKFDAMLSGSNTNLVWETAADNNISTFEIEYSNDGVDFKKVKTISALSNTSEQKYAEQHVVNNNTFHYYRLKIVSLDGSFTYSKVVKLKSAINSSQLQIEAYPTITASQTTISIHANSTSQAAILVRNMAGQTIISRTIKLTGNSQTISLNLSSYAKGMYNVSVQTEHQSKAIQIIKQ